MSAAEDYPNTLLFIDGTWRPGARGCVMAVENPANGKTIGTVAVAVTEDLDDALAAAQRGFTLWRKTPAFERGTILRRAAALIRERSEKIATHLTLEQGKPIAEAHVEALLAADILEWFAGEGQRAYGRIIPARVAGVTQHVTKEPVGPVAAFTPWNFPINQAVRKIAPALAAGCSIIIKAPEETPASPAALVQALADAGVPAGVINLIYGVPADISRYLIPHPVIRKVSFTGSIAVGKQLAALAGQHMKLTTMELGGHAPVFVTKDVDVPLVTRALVGHKFRAGGQTCISPTRFLVEAPIYDQFVDLFVAGAKTIAVGDGMANGTQLGPLISDRRVKALENLVADAVEHGAHVATGGSRIGDCGAFFEPTVLTGLSTEMRIMNEEPFGPIALMIPFHDLDCAIAEANRLPVGLGSYAFTKSGAAAARLASEVDVGMMTINHLGLGLPEVPFGGVRDSGHGSEGGSEAIEAYLTPKFVTELTL